MRCQDLHGELGPDNRIKDEKLITIWSEFLYYVEKGAIATQPYRFEGMGHSSRTVENEDAPICASPQRPLLPKNTLKPPPSADKGGNC